MDIRTLTPADVGRAVVYTPRHGEREDGVITGWSDLFVFVRYGVQTVAKATHPMDLAFLRDARPQ